MHDFCIVFLTAKVDFLCSSHWFLIKMLELRDFFEKKIDSRVWTKSYIFHYIYIGEPICMTITFILQSYYSFLRGQSWCFSISSPFLEKNEREPITLSSHRNWWRTNLRYTKTDPESSSRDLSIDIKFDIIGRGHLKPPLRGGVPVPKDSTFLFKTRSLSSGEIETRTNLKKMNRTSYQTISQFGMMRQQNFTTIFEIFNFV